MYRTRTGAVIFALFILMLLCVVGGYWGFFRQATPPSKPTIEAAPTNVVGALDLPTATPKATASIEATVLAVPTITPSVSSQPTLGPLATLPATSTKAVLPNLDTTPTPAPTSTAVPTPVPTATVKPTGTPTIAPPTATARPTDTPTVVPPTSTPEPTAVPAPTLTPTPLPPLVNAPGQYIDIGNPRWNGVLVFGFVDHTDTVLPCGAGYGGDRTAVNQKHGQKNILAVEVTPGKDVTVEVWVGHGYAQDHWVLYGDGHKLTETSNDSGCAPIYYKVTISGKDVTTNRLELVFDNDSTDSDGAGLWGLRYTQP